MLRFYYVKQPLWGIPAGHVERFADHKGAVLERDGLIEPYDPKKHAGAPGAPGPDKAPQPKAAKPVK